MNCTSRTISDEINHRERNLKIVHMALIQLAKAVADGEVEFGNSDMFAKITVGAQEFIEATQQDDDWINPKWTTMKFIDCGQDAIDITYTLWDEDVLSNNQYAISDGAVRYIVKLSGLSGVKYPGFFSKEYPIEGDHWYYTDAKVVFDVMIVPLLPGQ